MQGAQQTDLENDIREGNVNSDSGDSSDDVKTPPSSDEGFFGDESRLRKKGPLIRDNTDFKCFKWVVGQRFTSRQRSYTHTSTY